MCLVIPYNIICIRTLSNGVYIKSLNPTSQQVLGQQSFLWTPRAHFTWHISEVISTWFLSTKCANTHNQCQNLLDLFLCLHARQRRLSDIKKTSPSYSTKATHLLFNIIYPPPLCTQTLYPRYSLHFFPIKFYCTHSLRNQRDLPSTQNWTPIYFELCWRVDYYLRREILLPVRLSRWSLLLRLLLLQIGLSEEWGLLW